MSVKDLKFSRDPSRRDPRNPASRYAIMPGGLKETPKFVCDFDADSLYNMNERQLDALLEHPDVKLRYRVTKTQYALESLVYLHRQIRKLGESKATRALLRREECDFLAKQQCFCGHRAPSADLLICSDGRISKREAKRLNFFASGWGNTLWWRCPWKRA